MMDFDAVVYTSQLGHTRRYAEMLGQMTGKPVIALENAVSALPGGSRIIYLGWIHASHIKGYQQAAKRFSVPVVCGVGLCDNGTLLDEVRKTTRIPDNVPLFTLQGGMDRSKLKGLDKLMIAVLEKGLAAKKDRSAQDDRMLELLRGETDFVQSENLGSVLRMIEE